MQRLVVARTLFMRSSTMEEDVGLLMFDEPSASLDHTAEHGTIPPAFRFPLDPEGSSFLVCSLGFESCEGT
jgi:hypothetical protein